MGLKKGFFHNLFRRSSGEHQEDAQNHPPQPQTKPSAVTAPQSTPAAAVPTKRPPLSVSIREQLVDIHARAKKVAQATGSPLDRIVETESEGVEVENQDENRLKADTNVKAPRLQNIFASPLDLTTAFVPPVHAKSPTQSEFIRTALADNFVFDSLQAAEMKTLIDAFELYSVPKAGTTIITQGEVGDYFYILERGSISFHVNGVHVGDANTGQTFGELALLYNCPRAATCTSTVADVTLWRVDQETFRRILASHTQTQEKETLDLLRRVDILANHLDDVYLGKLVDAVSMMTFDNGQCILRKGDPGRAFYILKSGKIKISDIEVGGIKYEDNILDTPGKLCR
jgi:cAMP-dependent protein kinase regulator